MSPVAVPHMCIHEDIYEGFHIPAGEMLFWDCMTIGLRATYLQNQDNYNWQRLARSTSFLRVNTNAVLSRAILHDKDMYPEAMPFQPERFLKQEGKELPTDPTSTDSIND